MIVRVSMAQFNAKVGDLERNVEKAIEAIKLAEMRKADILLLPELFITGYPPEDLVLKPSFLKDNIRALEEVAKFTEGKSVTVVVGFIDVDDDAYNAAGILRDGKIVARYRKMFLPNYNVFDEQRYFKSGKSPMILDFEGIRVGVTICEDIWHPYGPIGDLVFSEGAQLILNISASPYFVGKRDLRKKYIGMKAFDFHVPIVYLNLVGGQDEIVFDGTSFVVNADGDVICELEAFEEDFVTMDISVEDSLRANLHDPRRRQGIVKGNPVEIIKMGKLSNKEEKLGGKIAEDICREEEMLRALVLGTRDYIRKNGFEKVVIGLSGGIDSSLVATIAVEALGKENVVGVLMPSMYTSKESVEDATELAKNLGIKTFTIPITDVFQSYLKVLKDVFKGTEPDVTEENIQARIRGNYLMALSNKFGWIVLTTGNKSEMATGYTTLYGDMAGGFAVLKDVYKTDVYRIARWINEKKGREIIPQRIFEKPPSAELKPDQTDQEKLPPYDILDRILKLYVEEDRSTDEIIEEGFPKELVESVIKMVDGNEYKRRQAPPGIKITKRAFGKDRRMPITNGYKDTFEF